MFKTLNGIQFVRKIFHLRKMMRKRRLRMAKKRELARKKVKKKSSNLTMMEIRFLRRNQSQWLLRKIKATEFLQIKIR